jgi:hypothetical protein
MMDIAPFETLIFIKSPPKDANSSFKSLKPMPPVADVFRS